MQAADLLSHPPDESNGSSRPRTAPNGGSDDPLSSELFRSDDIQWQFQAAYPDPATTPATMSLAFPGLSQGPTFGNWPHQQGQYAETQSIFPASTRPVTAPATSPNDYHNFLSAAQRGFPNSNPAGNPYMESLGHGRPRGNVQQQFGENAVNNWDQRMRILSLPENSFSGQNSNLPDEPSSASLYGSRPHQGSARPATSGGALPALYQGHPYHGSHFPDGNAQFPGSQSHPIFGGPIARPFATVPAGPQSASSVSQHYPFSHDPFPIASPAASRPNTAGARLMSMPANSGGILSHAATNEHNRPTTAVSSRPDTATSYSSVTSTGTATLGDLSSQIAEPGQTATAIGADGRVYQFVGVATHQKKRARRRFDEIERMYNCNYPGCTKSYGVSILS